MTTSAWPIGRIVQWPFVGKAGLRGGWRVLGFVVMFIVGSELMEAWLPHITQGAFTAPRILAKASLLLALVAGATLCLGVLEKRGLGDYGLPARGVRGLGWGAALAFGSLSVLVLLLNAAGAVRFGGTSASPAQMVLSGALWAAAFLVVGLFEELLLRGYAQVTLARSLGFWPAAFLLSVLFAAMHARNPGETRLGVLAVACFGLFFCWTLRRTGNLWFAVGFHASWDWAESFFYGVPNSGTLIDGHLLSASFSGPAWLSGGTAGPEGSVLVLAVFAAAALTLRRRVTTEAVAGLSLGVVVESIALRPRARRVPDHGRALNVTGSWRRRPPAQSTK